MTRWERTVIAAAVVLQAGCMIPDLPKPGTCRSFAITSWGGGAPWDELRWGVDVVHIEPTRNFQETFALCWDEILRQAVKREVQWVFSVEQDVICPPLTTFDACTKPSPSTWTVLASRWLKPLMTVAGAPL